MGSLNDVRRHCCVSDEEAQELTSHEGPILLLERRRYAARIDELIRARYALGELEIGLAIPANLIVETHLEHKKQSAPEANESGEK